MTLALPAYAWTPSPNYSSRNGQKVRLICAHDCEGNYNGSIGWFSMAQSKVSAHIVLSEDGARATQMVAWANKAWHACFVNSFSEGIEAAGYSAKGLDQPEWRALANVVAYRLRVNGIPCQRATAANNWTGWCQHVELGLAGGGHHDVTSDPAVISAFAEMIAMAYDEPMPADWGTSRIVSTPPSLPTEFVPHGAVKTTNGFKPTDVRHDNAIGSLEWVQTQLNALGVPTVPLTVDGIDGWMTRDAIEAFQRRAGLAADGEAGPLTVAALEKALAK